MGRPFSSPITLDWTFSEAPDEMPEAEALAFRVALKTGLFRTAKYVAEMGLLD